MKRTPDGMDGRLDSAEEKVSELEGVTIETLQDEIQENRFLKDEQSSSELRDSFRRACVRAVGGLAGKCS